MVELELKFEGSEELRAALEEPQFTVSQVARGLGLKPEQVHIWLQRGQQGRGGVTLGGGLGQRRGRGRGGKQLLFSIQHLWRLCVVTRMVDLWSCGPADVEEIADKIFATTRGYEILDHVGDPQRGVMPRRVMLMIARYANHVVGARLHDARAPSENYLVRIYDQLSPELDDKALFGDVLDYTVLALGWHLRRAWIGAWRAKHDDEEAGKGQEWCQFEGQGDDAKLVPALTRTRIVEQEFAEGSDPEGPDLVVTKVIGEVAGNA